ncbi:hypothetical protein KCU61_g11, partial [Aureobasidium melanogenum]
MVSISAFQALDPGSIPGCDISFANDCSIFATILRLSPLGSDQSQLWLIFESQGFVLSASVLLKYRRVCNSQSFHEPSFSNLAPSHLTTHQDPYNDEHRRSLNATRCEEKSRMRGEKNGIIDLARLSRRIPTMESSTLPSSSSSYSSYSESVSARSSSSSSSSGWWAGFGAPGAALTMSARDQ